MKSKNLFLAVLHSHKACIRRDDGVAQTQVQNALFPLCLQQAAGERVWVETASLVVQDHRPGGQLVHRLPNHTM